MRLVVIAVALILALSFPSPPVFAAPCAPGTLQDYIDLGSGCTIGSVTVSEFVELAPPAAATPIAPTAINVAPLVDASNPGLMFRLNALAGPGQFLDAFFGFRLTDAVVGASLAVAGASATGDGAVTVIEDLCRGAQLIGVACGGETTTLITFAIDGDTNLTEAASFASVPLLGVLADIGVDGGLDGSGALETVILRFQTAATTVPEPSTLALLALAVIVLWLGQRSRIRA